MKIVSSMGIFFMVAVSCISVTISSPLASVQMGVRESNPYNLKRGVVDKEFFEYARSLYGEIGLEDHTDFKTFASALIGYTALKRKGMLKKDILVLIDYSQPSDKERFFVIDMKKKNVVYRSLVAHGRFSGERFASYFSNRPGSYKSCLGFFITGKTYRGRHGTSLLLHGVEPGINDNAVKRRIVIHGADYVSRSFIRKYGRIGRSLGCPALPVNLATSIIKTIKGGSCVFMFGRDETYFRRSHILNDRKIFSYVKSLNFYGVRKID